jgi:hypothetical protein
MEQMKAWELDPTIPRPWSAIKKYWRYMREPCARCHRQIDYDGPRFYFIRRRGFTVRVSNRFALDVGHIVNRMDDPRMLDGRWDHGSKYSPNETQPEHSFCNRRAGARDGNRRRRLKKVLKLKTSRKW